MQAGRVLSLQREDYSDDIARRPRHQRARGEVVSGGKPLGYLASLEDWNEAYAGRPMNLSDWNQLTLGEQNRYAARECKTNGAVYSSKVSSDHIEFSIKLPPSLAMHNLTSDEAGALERYLHRRIEEQVAAILTIRQIKRDNP